MDKNVENVNINKKDLVVIKKLCEALKIGEYSNVKKQDAKGCTNFIFDTEQGKYLLRKFSKESIKSSSQLSQMKKQINAFDTLSKNGVPCIVPMSIEGKFFILYQNTYYLVYNYYSYSKIEKTDIKKKKIKRIANTLAIVNKLNMTGSLPCYYTKLNINYKKYIKKYENANNELHMLLSNNGLILEDLTNLCNQNIKTVSENLCLSFGPYDINKIIWQDDYMYLDDFHDICLVNPIVSCAETAFNVSYQNGKINEEFYKEFLRTYFKKYGESNLDYRTALFVAVGTRLRKLGELFEEDKKLSKTNTEIIENLLKEIFIYNDSINRLFELYLSVTEK